MTDTTEATPVAAPATTVADTGTLLTTATPAEPDWTTTVPDKFKVDGEINHQAIYQGYQQLENRMRDTGMPPEAADKYAYEYAEGTADDAKIGEEQFSNLQKYAFENGFSQKQFIALADGWKAEVDNVRSQVIDEYNLDPAKQVESARAVLLEAFKDPAILDKNLTQAANALIKIVPDAALRSAISDELGNNPNLIKALAQFGSTLREDAPIPPAHSQPVEDMTKLIASSAARNPHHPEYAMTRAKIDAFFASGGSIRQARS